MKILQVGKFYPIRGGVEKVMYDLMLGLSDQCVNCDMLCASTEDYPAGDIVLNEFAKLMVVPTKIKLAATMLAPHMVTRLRKIAKQYDVIHVHHPDPMACLALFLAGYKGKVILHWHSDIVKQKNLLKLYSPLQSWLIQRADIIVGTSPVYVKESPFLQGVQDKVDYVPIGVEPLVSDATSVRRIRDLYGDKRIVFSLGRLIGYKGYEYLLKAAAHLDDSYQVVIGGKGPLKASLVELARDLGLDGRVHFVDFISDEELPSYFGAADVFCLSSIMKTEAFAIVQIEAMSLAKPVVSTRIPGSGVSWVNADGESGATVPIEDGLALAEAIKSVVEDSERYARLSAGALARFESLFTRRSMVAKALSLYQKILN